MKSSRCSDEIFGLWLQMKLNPPPLTLRSKISSRSDFIHDSGFIPTKPDLVDWCGRFLVKYSAHAECEIIHFVNCEILLPLVAMWNEINPLTRRSAFHTRSVFHASSAFHKSRQGFISLKKAHICPVDKSAFFWCGRRDDWNASQAMLRVLLCKTSPVPAFLKILYHKSNILLSEIFGLRRMWNNSLCELWNIAPSSKCEIK